MDGWVKFHRRFLDSDLWLSEPFTKGQAWVDLFSIANHKNGFIRVRGNRVEVKRGQVGWSQVRLAKRWKWSRGKVRRFLDELEDIDKKIVQQKTRITTLINIIKYELYQADDTTGNTTDGQQTDNRRYTNKNEKNEKNNKKKKIKKKSFSPPTPEEVQNYFFENGYTKESGLNAWKYYNDGNWKDAGGKQVLSWKQKMRGVWFKPENKINNRPQKLNGNSMSRSDQNAVACMEFIEDMRQEADYHE
jgi:hypothetical protein